MELTPRQQAFLDALFDLYCELGGPVHYSVVAERLGVNRFSAYDMLRLLEQKGVVASSYALKDEHSGPGRTMVVFYPTNRASRHLTRLRDQIANRDDWYQTRQRLLNQLRQTKEGSYNKTLREILARLPGVKTPLAYCTEMLSVLLLNMAQASQKAGQLFSYGLLSSMVVEGQVGLGTLAGFSLGSLMSFHADDPSLADKLARHIREFQTQLGELSEESINRLTAYAQDALKLLERVR
jgi:DNA-binding PadR family transcriptional regulator